MRVTAAAEVDTARSHDNAASIPPVVMGRATAVRDYGSLPPYPRLSGLRLKGRYCGDVHRALCKRQVVIALQGHPEAGAVAK